MKPFSQWDKREKDKFDLYVSDCIIRSEEYMQNTGVVDLWSKIAMYIEGYQYPIGFYDNNVQEWFRNNYSKFDVNKFQLKKDPASGMVFYADNRIGEMEKGYMGEFGSVKRILTPRHDDNPSNDGLQYAMRHYSNKYEYANRTWEQVRIPSIRNMLRYNIGYEQSAYNPYVNVVTPMGKDYKMKTIAGNIEMDYYYPWRVLIDPLAINRFLLDSRYIIPFKVLSLEDAKIYLELLGVNPDDVKADNDDAFVRAGFHSFKQLNSDPTVTIYFPEYRRAYINQYDTGMEVSQMGELQGTIIKEMTVEYFGAIYTKNLGTVYHCRNIYANPRLHNQWQFSITPYIDEHSDVTILSAGTLGKMLILQDVWNMLQTMRLNNSRQRSLLRLIMKKTLKDKLGDSVVNEFLSDAGVIGLPDDVVDGELKDSMHWLNMPDLDDGISEFLMTVDESFKRIGIRKDILMGKTPKREMSGKLAREIKESNATLLAPTVDSISWAVGTTARRIYHICAQEYDTQDWVDILDAKKDDPRYIPINATMTFNEFNQYLMKAYPSMPLMEAAKRFEEHNDVRVKKVQSTDGRGQLLEPEAIMNQYSRVEINHLKDKDGNPANFSFKVTLDFDLEDQELETKILITKMFLSNPKSPTWRELFLRAQGGYMEAQADELIDKFAKEDKASELIELLMSNPDLQQQLEAMVQQYMAMMQAGKQQQLAQAGGTGQQAAPAPMQIAQPMGV